MSETPGRHTVLAEIENNAINFAWNLLSDIELPSNPEVSLGNMRGFEDIHTDFKHVSGVININASFQTLSGVKIRMVLPIPVYKGEFYKPTVCVLSSKKTVFSQDAIDKLIASLEHDKPIVHNMHNPSHGFTHEPVINKGIFADPDHHSDFFDYVVNRH